MATNAFALPCAGIAPEELTRFFNMSDLTLPFWGYRKAMPMHKIVRLEGEGNYTLFHFADGTRLMVSLTLKTLESRLSSAVFARAHKKNIVNMLYLEDLHPVAISFPCSWPTVTRSMCRAVKPAVFSGR